MSKIVCTISPMCYTGTVLSVDANGDFTLQTYGTQGYYQEWYPLFVNSDDTYQQVVIFQLATTALGGSILNGVIGSGLTYGLQLITPEQLPGNWATASFNISEHGVSTAFQWVYDDNYNLNAIGGPPCSVGMNVGLYGAWSNGTNELWQCNTVVSQ